MNNEMDDLLRQALKCLGLLGAKLIWNPEAAFIQHEPDSGA